MEDDYDYNVIKEVGKVSYETLQYAKSIVKEGKSLLSTAEEIEKFMKDKGFECAFPVNLSINSWAAHYTPTADDKTVFTAKDIIKVDIGARKGAYLGDCAVTVDLTGKYSKLVEASEEALKSAISLVKAGRKVCEIGAEVEKVSKKFGFNPIKNLGGHGVERGDLHASIFIPNYDNGDETELEEGQVIAIETFLTDGEGMVTDGDVVQIFQKHGPMGLRDKDSRKVSDFIDKAYSTNPFAMRWLINEFKSEFMVKKAINEMASTGELEIYPVLMERSGGMVSQAEKEMIVETDSCTILTK